MITVMVSIPRKMKRNDPVFAGQGLEMPQSCPRGNHPLSDEVDASHRRNNTQDSRITQIKHMSVVKAIGLYEHANTGYPIAKGRTEHCQS
jgi:hypothetical protein